MLVGEPGIGKTRTTQELATYVRMRAGVVLWGGAQESAGAPPYWPWLQVARSYRDQIPEEERRKQWQPYATDLQRIFTGLTELFPGLPEPPPLDSEEGQFRLFDAFSSFLRAVATDKPLLVVLDDLHWADRSTLQMLIHVARELAHARVLVVATYRDTDLDRQHPLSRTLAELNREQLFTRINLRGLTREEVAEYIRAAAQVEPPSALVDRVHEETEGNAFFLTEVVNLMAQEGSLDKTSISDLAIPEGVKEALGRRLDRLSAEANELLSVAAVIGREFEHTQLVRVSEKPDDELLSLVEEALSARVLEETAVIGGYRFTHALMQETLLGELSAARQVQMHGRIAHALESLYPSPSREQLAELAGHYRESALLNRDDAGRAIVLTHGSAEQAREQLAWDQEARLLDAVLRLTDEHGVSEGLDEAEIQHRLTASHYSLGDPARASAHFWQCHRLLTERQDFLGVAELAAEFGARTLLGLNLGPAVSADALEQLSSEQRVARPDLEVTLRVQGIADALAPTTDADAELTELEKLAETSDLWSEQAGVLHLRAVRALAANDPAGAAEFWRQSTGLRVEHGRADLAAPELWGQGGATRNAKGLDEADAVLAVVEGLRQAGRRFSDAAHADRASNLAMRGEFALASQWIDEWTWSSPAAANVMATQVAFLAELRGDPDGIRAAVDLLEHLEPSDALNAEDHQARVGGWLRDSGSISTAPSRTPPGCRSLGTRRWRQWSNHPRSSTDYRC
jgi:hypothetical protein